MGYPERTQIYEDIESIRDRPLIAFVTSPRPNASGRMASDVIPQFMRQLSLLKDVEEDRVDLMVVSSGGDPTVAWRIITLVREHFDHVSILLPDIAYSAATLLALGADEIQMHSFANLGPVDPQITYVSREEDESRRESFAAEDLRHFIEFVKEDLGISDQEQMEKTFRYVCEEVGATKIGFARKSTHLMISMGEKLLRQHMEDEKEASAIAQELSRSFYHHGYPLSRSEADEIGLPISDPDEPLRSLMRKVWRDFEEEMCATEPFSPMEEVLTSSESDKLLSGIQQFNVPQGINQQQQQQVLQAILNQVDSEVVEPVEYSLFQAALESTRAYSRFEQEGRIFAQRLPDSRIRTNKVPVTQGWAYETAGSPVNEAHAERTPEASNGGG